MQIEDLRDRDDKFDLCFTSLYCGAITEEEEERELDYSGDCIKIVHPSPEENSLMGVQLRLRPRLGKTACLLKEQSHGCERTVKAWQKRW